MTQEEKAKRYDETLEKAKRWHIDCQIDFKKSLEALFPELKESEDERISREITKFLVGFNNGEYERPNENTIDSWLSWLEKQGEQKSDDKAEPKFHKNDWVVCEVTGSVHQIKNCIENLSNHKYGYDLTDGGYIGSDEVNHYHLWTIEDSKDGDVLYSLDSKQPFIFKYRKPNEQAKVYCGINIYGEFFVWNTKDCIITTDKYIPATKEQRNTLMEEMADAGYTFDFEKKELKKKN